MVVVGLEGINQNETFFTAASLVCSRLSLEGEPVCGTTTIEIPGGSGAGTPVDAPCPEGTIARSFRTGAGCGQDVLDLYCADAVPECTGDSICEPRCGDGIVVPGFEECDDGNTCDGDGCSSSCEDE